ncbi:DEAD/DEAH box helicase family protein [Candidatus Mycoplasma pogonae]
MLTRSQENAVNRIVKRYIEHTRKDKIVDFKAPTGSGKTFMASYIISKIAEYINIYKPSKKVMFVIATISNAELPKAFSKKIEYYKKYLPFQNLNIEHRVSPSSTDKGEDVKKFYVENNKVLIFGTSSFGKKKLFTELGILNDFIQEAKNDPNLELIYIRDEAHRGDYKSGDIKIFDQNFDSQLIDVASFVIKMTATPKNLNYLIELTPEELENDEKFLLKTEGEYPKLEEIEEDYFALKNAIKKFKEIQKEYKKLEKDEIYINPAMLIQVRSEDSKGSAAEKKFKKEEFDKNIAEIIKLLVDNGLSYLKYFSNDKVSSNLNFPPTLEEASKHNSLFDVIIFKVGPATGWDIPRACMLVQLRRVSSEQLNIQTIGRIKRNPHPLLEKNEITNKYYLYSDFQESTRFNQSYKLKPKFENVQLASGFIKNKQEINEKNENSLLNKIEEKILNHNLTNQQYLENEKSTKLEIPKAEISYIQNATTGEKVNDKEYFKNKINLRIYILNSLEKYKYLFTPKINDYLKKYCEKENLDFDIFIYTLITKKMRDLETFYKEALIINRENEEYKINIDTKMLDTYNVWISKNQLSIDNIHKYQNYAYEEIVDSEKKEEFQKLYLDSKPEKDFIDKLFESLNKYNLIKNNEKNSNLISLFSKLPTQHSDINFEYFNEKEYDSGYRQSYIDFVIKTKFGFQYFIEVKSKYNDYDKDKTYSLKLGYQKYMKSYFSNTISLLIGLVNTENQSVEIVLPQKKDHKHDKITLNYLIEKIFFNEITYSHFNNINQIYLKKLKEFVNENKENNPSLFKSFYIDKDIELVDAYFYQESNDDPENDLYKNIVLNYFNEKMNINITIKDINKFMSEKSLYLKEYLVFLNDQRFNHIINEFQENEFPLKELKKNIDLKISEKIFTI